MASLNFPSSPTEGQIHTANNRSWRWNGSSWTAVSTTGVSDSVLIEAIADAIHSASLTYASDGDANGAVYYIGTQGLTTSFVNPGSNTIDPWRIQITPISSADNPVHVTNRAVGHNITATNTIDDFMAFDLGPGRQLVMNKYSLKNHGDGSGYLRNWKIQGSNNVTINNVAGITAATWEDIDTQTANATAAGANAWVSIDVSSSIGYRWIRVKQNGLNSNGAYHIALGEVEFYGLLETFRSSVFLHDIMGQIRT